VCFTANCYEKVKKETELIRKTVEEKIGDNPENQGVVVLYENEKPSLEEHQVNDISTRKILVEIPKSRPEWFNSNLLQRSTVGRNTESKRVVTTLEKPKLSS